MSQHVAGSRLTSNIKITLKIKFTSEILADITRSLVVVLQHLRFCKKILILIFFSDLFSVECKFFCPNSADNTMENRAISLVESSRDNSLISCPTSSGLAIPFTENNCGPFEHIVFVIVLFESPSKTLFRVLFASLYLQIFIFYQYISISCPTVSSK